MAGGIIQLSEGAFRGNGIIIDADGTHVVTVQGMGGGEENYATQYNYRSTADTIAIKAGGALKDIRISTQPNTVASITVGNDAIANRFDLLDNVSVKNGYDNQTGTGILFTANAATAAQHVMLCTFGPIYIRGFEYAIKYEADEAGGNEGHLNDNFFERIGVWGCVYAWEPTMGATSYGGATIAAMSVQPKTGATLRGLHLMPKVRLRVLSYEYWDYVSPQVPLLVDADCANNQVVGYWSPGTETNNATPGKNIITNLGDGVTQNSGTDTIASGDTTKVVAHGLDGTPTIINISFREQGTSDFGRWWVDTIGATNFTLNVSADPGASNLDFGWEAKL